MERGPEDPGKNYRTQGRLMYADYSPLEDDRNLVEIIKEFTSLASRMGRMDANGKKLAALLSDSDGLRQDIIAAIKNIRTDTTFTMDKFRDKHVDVLSNELLTKGAALLMDTKNSLSELLKNTETGFDEQHTRYREKIALMINENNSAASNLVQTWLAADSMNLPRPILANLAVTAGASLDRKSGAKNYETFRTTASAATVQSGQPGDSAQKGTDALQFSYTFQIDPSELEFWNYRRIVTDLGIRELLLPVGMEAPVSERIKKSFRFGSRKDAEVMKEPEFVKADGYCLIAASLNDNKTLVVELAKDPARPEESGLFRITYDVASLSVPGQPHASAGARPKLDYLVQDGGNLITESDLLQIAEIQKNSDMSKLHLLGSAVLARIRILQDPQVIRSRGTLTELRTRNDNVVIPSGLQEGNYRALFEFLESIAFSYAPFVKKMQEKTSVNGELVLKEELGGGQRKEYSVRVDELRSQLKDTEHGKMIAAAMGL
ncbi:MAG TPA: hypothetical protein VIE86_07910 [Nitrososphaera sp.]|jgi:hypothetical protein